MTPGNMRVTRVILPLPDGNLDLLVISLPAAAFDDLATDPSGD